MSPRSAELLALAQSRLASARRVLPVDSGAAVSLAYYAMLYAARAALSEEDLNARTHRGTWTLFRERFVVERRFDQTLFSAAQNTQADRVGVDYNAIVPSRAEAESVIGTAQRFVEAVEKAWP